MTSRLTVERIALGRPQPTAGRALVEECSPSFPLRERTAARRYAVGGDSRCSRGRALAASKVLLLDEPSENQPNIVQESSEDRLISRARGLAVVLVEQNIEFAAALARALRHGKAASHARSPERVMDEDIVRDYLAV